MIARERRLCASPRLVEFPAEPVEVFGPRLWCRRAGPGTSMRSYRTRPTAGYGPDPLQRGTAP